MSLFGMQVSIRFWEQDFMQAISQSISMIRIYKCNPLMQPILCNFCLSCRQKQAINSRQLAGLIWDLHFLHMQVWWIQIRLVWMAMVIIRISNPNSQMAISESRLIQPSIRAKLRATARVNIIATVVNAIAILGKRSFSMMKALLSLVKFLCIIKAAGQIVWQLF